jgi:hypothetical protein
MLVLIGGGLVGWMKLAPERGNGASPVVEVSTQQTTPEAPTPHLIPGLAKRDVTWALKDIQKACGGSRRADIAAQDYGSSPEEMIRKGLGGALKAEVYADGLPRDVSDLIRVYRGHPDSMYQQNGQGMIPMRNVMLNAAAQLDNGYCDGAQARRIERELRFTE